MQQAVNEIGDNPEIQKYLLKTLFQAAAIEGAQEVTDRRDGAFAILTDQAIQPIMKAHSFVLHDAYIEAIGQQTVRNDSVSGSINTLLDTGKAIAPYLPHDLRSIRQIANAWEAVAGKFPTINDQFHIRSKLEEIKQRMSPTWVIDNKVEMLRRRSSLHNEEIAQLIGEGYNAVVVSVRRLIAAGRIEPGKGGQKRKTLAP